MRIAYMRSPFRGPVIPDDGGTVAHVYFNGSQLVDKYGNAWTQNGTVPQVARNGRIPAGAGPMSVANFYATTAVNDVLDFGSDFSVCVVATVGNSPAQYLITAGLNSAGFGGWAIVQTNTNDYRFDTYSAAGALVSTTVTAASSSPLVICAGRSGSTQYVKADLGTIASSGSANNSPDTSHASRIGIGPTGTLPLVNGIVYEIWASTTTPTDALFIAIMQKVRSRLQITAW